MAAKKKSPFTVLQEYVTVEVLNIQPLNMACSPQGCNNNNNNNNNNNTFLPRFMKMVDLCALCWWPSNQEIRLFLFTLML